MKMNYPLISEYIESISSAEDNFEELSQLRPVLDDDGLPVMTSGNFAVVFKMMDERDGKFYAVKCFTKEQEERAEAYKQITEELKDVESPYLISVRYLDKELFVDTKQTIETEFPVLLMDWVEGKTLDKYLRENLEDKYALEMLAYRFSQLAQWLVPQPFAHGDLKPDNILVREDGTLVLVDYDGMYVPAMKGQKARELGSPDFRHPLRTEDDFDEHIDDFPIVLILLSLMAISYNPLLLSEYGAADRLLFSKEDFYSFSNSKIFKSLILINYDDWGTVLSIFTLLCNNSFLFKLPSLKKPGRVSLYTEENGILYTNLLNKRKANTDYSKETVLLDDVLLLHEFLSKNRLEYVITGTVALSLYGLLPNDYLPHDIDVQIFALYYDYERICSILERIENYCGEEKPTYEESETKIYGFYVGNNSVSVNVFVHKQGISCDDYNIIVLNEQFIKVHKVMNVLRYKYAMKREKDYSFHLDLIKKMGDFLIVEK